MYNITAQTTSEEILQEESLVDMAQRLTQEVSPKFTPLTGRKDNIIETMVAIKKFNNKVRWQEKWRTKRQLIRLNKIIDTGKLPDSDVNDEPSLDEKFELVPGRDGLRTGLVPINRPKLQKLLLIWRIY